MLPSHSNLTIGVVASATNMGVAVLRAWEARYGFPAPDRTPSGHRRYGAHHVEQIRQVQRDRHAGMSLGAAIARTRSDFGRSDPSIFAGLRRRRPGLPLQVLSKRAMIALSRAIEDECSAHSERPLVFGSFQRERYYRQSERRWRQLTGAASQAIVFADFPSSRERSGAPTEVAVALGEPLRREWAVVCDAPHAAACLVAVERPGSSDLDGGRQFEAVWSVDPPVVRDAAEIAAGIARAGGVQMTTSAAPAAVADPVAALRCATALLDRTIAYLDT